MRKLYLQRRTAQNRSRQGRERRELFSHRIRQTSVVSESFDRPSVLHSDRGAHRVSHLLHLDLREVRLILVPAGPKLANVFCASTYSLFHKLADVDPNILVFMSAIIKHVFGNHVLLEAFLSNL